MLSNLQRQSVNLSARLANHQALAFRYAEAMYATSKEIRRRNLKIVWARNHLAKRSLKDLAISLDTNPSYINQLLSGNRGMGDTVARKFEKKLELTEGELDSLWPDPDGLADVWKPKHQEEDDTPKVPVRVVGFTIRGIDGKDGLDELREALIKVVDIEVSAGSDGIPIPEFVETRYELPYQLSWLHDWGARPEDIMIVPVQGRSMEGVLWSRDVAVVHRRRTKIRDEGVFVFIRPGGASIKRLFNRDDGGMKIVSNNPDKDAFPDEIIPAEDMYKYVILGQVIDKHGPGGLGL